MVAQFQATSNAASRVKTSAGNQREKSKNRERIDALKQRMATAMDELDELQGETEGTQVWKPREEATPGPDQAVPIEERAKELSDEINRLEEQNEAKVKVLAD